MRMKAIGFIRDKQKRKAWLRAFRMWQRRSYEVAPLSEESHACASCGTTFTGNYCPRCGQAASVGRFSFKKAFLLFLDVWGVGNRSMFRSIRDLMLRPGYMIRDYLSGMQSAYFPPFKMFFLLAAFSLLVEHGFSLGLDESEPRNADEAKLEIVKTTGVEEPQDSGYKPTPSHLKEIDLTKEPIMAASKKFAKGMDMLRKKNPAAFSLLSLLLFSLPLFFFLRKNPNIPDLRFSEFIVALVYTSNTYSLYSIVGNLLNSDIFRLLAFLMIFVALHELSGYSKRRVFCYIVLTTMISVTVLIALVAIGISIVYAVAGN